MKRSSKLLILLAACIVAGVGVFAAHAVFAQVSVDLPTSFAGFSSQDLKVTIANIVRIVLGFIGILFLLLILYGGFVWMTSQGQPDKINRAKKIIASAVIGLLIVLSAYSIAGFIVQSLQQAASSGGPSGPPPPPPPPPIPGCPDPGPGPDGTYGTPDDPVKICYINGQANPLVYQGAVVTIRGYNFRNYNPAISKAQMAGTDLEIMTCSGAPQWSDQTIVARIPETVPAGMTTTTVTNNTGLICALTNCMATNVQIGNPGPQIICLTPNTGPSDGTQTVTIDGRNFGTTTGHVQMISATSSAPFDVNNPTTATNITSWADQKIVYKVPGIGTPGQAVTGDVTVLDSTGAGSNGVPFTVTCTPGNPLQCGAPNCCPASSNSCLPAALCPAAPVNPLAPVITSVVPDDGAPGNYISINGRNFGAAPGTLTLIDSTNVNFNNPKPTNLACTNWWSDTQIIMEVPKAPPTTAAPGATAITVTKTGLPPFPLTSAAWTSFVVNATVRPGLCQVTPAAGLPGTAFTLTGNNLPATPVPPPARDIFFGNPSSPISAVTQAFPNATTASGHVPNLVPATTTVGLKVGTEYSNPLNFTVQGVGAGDPIINSFNPSNGPTGTYVTIMGANFGTSVGRVFLRPVNAAGNCTGAFAPDCLADVSFPPICGTDYWRDDRIIVKIPSDATTLQNYFFVVERQSDSKFSQATLINGTNGTFLKDTTPVKPGICRIDPVGGPAGTPVQYDGENFGPAAGSVYFYNMKKATSAYSWTDRQVLNAQVPFNAITGTTTIVSTSNATSNALPFLVGSCTSNAQCGTALCCSGLCRAVAQCQGGNYDENNWEFKSGQYPFDLDRAQQCTVDIQSPTPFPYDQYNDAYLPANQQLSPTPPAYSPTDPVTNAPTNVVIAARFTRPLDFNSILGATPANDNGDVGARIYQCNTATAGVPNFSEPACAEITNQGVFAQVGTSGFSWKPSSPLIASTWYEVRFDHTNAATSLIKAQDGSFYQGSQFLGADPGQLQVDDFRWHFRTTSAAQSTCEASTVTLSPTALTAPIGGTSNLLSALAQSAQCYICGGGYTYAWTINPVGPPYATFSPLHLATDPDQQFVGQNITTNNVPPYTNVTATLTNNPSGPPITSGPAQLTVAFVPPFVVQYSPNSSCQAACTNVAPFATFNVDLDPATVGAATVTLNKCTTSACTTFNPVAGTTISYDVPNKRINITPPAAGLTGASWYRVIITNGVHNKQNQPLDPAHLNYPAATPNAFSWTFQTSLTLCEATAVTVSPASAVIPSIGGTQGYTAYPTAVTACGPLSINPSRYDYSWSSNDFNVAVIFGTTVLNYVSMQAVSATAGIPTPGVTQAHVDMSNKTGNPPVNLSAEGEVVVKDSRDVFNLIGHRPDNVPHSPPENVDGICDLNTPPGSCTNQCRNVAVSAIFSTSVDPASFTPPSTVSSADAYYSFNDGTAKDSSATPNNGVFKGSAAASSGNTTYPTLGKGAQFNGNTDASYVDIPSTPANSGSSGTFSVSEWIYPQHPASGLSKCVWTAGPNNDVPTATTCTTNADCGVMSGYPTTCSAYADVAYEPTVFKGFWDGNPAVTPAHPVADYDNISYGSTINALGYLGSVVRTGQHSLCWANAGIVPFDQWTHVAMTYDGTNFTLYQNGVQTTANCPGSIYPATNPLSIGGSISLTDTAYPIYFKGIIDDVQVYNRALSSTEVAQLRLQSIGQSGGSDNFYVSDTSNRVVPGTITVQNYTDSTGYCTIGNAACTTDSECATGFCSKKRGRVDFTPDLSLGSTTPAGIFAPNTRYQVNICQNGSCGTDPIMSYQGVPFVTPTFFGFQTTGNVCQISFVDINPNPAAFVNRHAECLATDTQCTSTVPKAILAQGKDQTGTDLGGLNYTWSPPTASALYTLNQPVANGPLANVQHKGTIGTDYNQVKADGGALVGSASAQGRMDFAFCENPWYGQGANDYYLDNVYDIKLSYCRDAAGPNPSDPALMLPALPNPHIERSNANANPFNFGGDLLKEHIFIVGTNNNSVGTIISSNPTINSVTQPQAVYHLGDLVYLKVSATDPEGDSFLYTMNPAAGETDQLPASANFNPRTGVLLWVVDQVPQTDSALDADTTNDYALTFGTSPAGTTQTVTINVAQGTPPATVSRPTVTFASASTPTQTIASGGTMTVNYGDTVTFNANVTGYGNGTANTVKSFVWDFQDSGLTSYTDSALPNPYTSVHAFVQSGVHQVTFRVQNDADVWSDPAVVNIVVRPKTSMLFQENPPVRSVATALPSIRLFMTDVSSIFTRVAWAQSQSAPPSGLTALSVDDASASNNLVNIQLAWADVGTYSGIHIYRDGALITTASGTATSYTDTAIVIGTDHVYKVCGIVNAQDQCSEITTTARRVDYDVIVARIYKNIGLLSIREWYETYAPNPTGSPKPIMVDGYDAIQDGTSVYVGIANCSNQTGCTGNPGIYTNVLLLSYNAGAQKSTVDTFNQLVNTIRINYQLVNRDDGSSQDYCSADHTISCVPGHDAVCQAKNAGLCTSAQAELRRDYKRLVDLQTIKASLDAYAAQNHFCNDGTNTHACNTNADCPSGNLCVAAYPSLTSGSYLPGISTSKWPSWNATLAQDLNGASLPTDPINKFGQNFYVSPLVDCTAFTGHDADTCWNQRTLQMRCHQGSEVYVYKNNLATNYHLYANAEDPGWHWANQDTAHIVLNDPTLGGLCRDATPVAAVCGNGVIEPGEVCDGGSRNYCDINFGDKNWNTDFQVGCNSTCTGWGAPAGADITWCHGACGDGTLNSPYEQCDGSVPATTQCTNGGSAYCSSSCQIACTSGHPYSGQCGDGIVQLPEVCDEGTPPPAGTVPNGLNGTPGHCNLSCTGYGSFCGDGTVTPVDQTDLGCTCTNAVSCPAGYRPVQGSACSKTCTAPALSYQFSCVKNNEECDTVSGLTNYSCPAGTSLYCDNQCNRACTTITINGSGNRTSIPLYEHYYNVAKDEGHDYTTLKEDDVPYVTKGIVFYVDPWTAACPAARSWYRWLNSKDHETVLRNYLPIPSDIANGWIANPAPQYEFCSYAPNAADPSIVPVYEFFYNRGTKADAPLDADFIYSRNSSTPPLNAEGQAYPIQFGGTPLFWARLGPLQETCGNDIIEGMEQCEPGTYKVPTAEQATSDHNQYQCGALFTPNACRQYGGWCGDGVKNAPFEQCDEGLKFVCSGNAATSCKTDTDCSKLGFGTCLGNGALCNNATGNCTYCTKSCSNGILPRNYCGDGIVNCGADAICGNADDVEVCDDGGDNGKSGKCNETCSGLTGSVCGNGTTEKFCSNNSTNACQTAADQTACTTGGGVCTGEACDDGPNNGHWTNTCANNTTACVTNADCTNAGVAGPCGSGTPRAYCSFSCLGPTVPYCGDGIVQNPDAGPDGKMGTADDTPETCDAGAALNGQPGQCNTTCNGITPPQCGNNIIDNGRCSVDNKPCTKTSDCSVGEGVCRGTGNCSIDTTKICQDNGGCTAAQGVCVGVETCDPPAAVTLQSCVDNTVGGKPGLQNTECSATCVSQTTQCEAFGLKIWSDGTDVAYLNGKLMLLNSPSSTCSVDPAPNGADYSSTSVQSPPTGNSCAP